MAIPEGKSEPPYLIPQKRVASTPDSGPIPKKPNNTTRMTRRRPEEKVEGSLDLENSKPTEDLTTDEVFGRLEAVRTDMATISWHMGLPKKLNIPEILCEFFLILLCCCWIYTNLEKWTLVFLICLNGRINTRLIRGWRRSIGSRMRIRMISRMKDRSIRRMRGMKKQRMRNRRTNQRRMIMKMLCRSVISMPRFMLRSFKKLLLMLFYTSLRPIAVNLGVVCVPPFELASRLLPSSSPYFLHYSHYHHHSMKEPRTWTMSRWRMDNDSVLTLDKIEIYIQCVRSSNRFIPTFKPDTPTISNVQYHL